MEVLAQHLHDLAHRPSPIASMSLLPARQPVALQDFIYPVLIADRNLQALNALMELEDWLEDTPVPGALPAIRQSIRSLRQTIVYISLVKLQRPAALQRALNAECVRHGRAPLVDLDW